MKQMIVIVATVLLATGCFHKSATPKEKIIENETHNPSVQLKSYPTPIASVPVPVPTQTSNATPPTSRPLVISSTEENSLKPRVTKVTLAAIGDVLIHDKIYWDAEQKDGTYQFTPMFGQVERFLERPDILVANQETMIGGKRLKLSSYPSFNSPHEVGNALKDVGVDMVTIANNHSLDRGEKVIQSALSHWDTLGMPYTGTFKSQSDREQIRIMTKNGITFSFLSYTYGTNGISTPKGKPFLINRIDENLIRQDVEHAKHLSDVIVVAVHWGKEYQRFPDHDQTILAQKLADMGIHIVIGNHPHVLQPPAWVTSKKGHRAFVMYSLGNFISAQTDLYKQIGGMATIEVMKTTSNNQPFITLQSPTFLPTFTYSDKGHQYRILPMDVLTNRQLPHAGDHYEKIKKHMRSYMSELQFLLTSDRL